MKHSGRQTCQIEGKTAPLAKEQLCEYENQTLEGFVATSRLHAKFDCAVACQKFSLLATARDCETGILHVTECIVALSACCFVIDY